MLGSLDRDHPQHQTTHLLRQNQTMEATTMADNLNYVSPGDNILASQYNTLVDAVGGPSDPNSSAPFVKTPSGSISTAGSPYIPKEQNDLHPPLFSLRFSYGDIPDIFLQPFPNFFGLWCFLGDSINTRWCKHEQTFENTRRFIIDTTTPPTDSA